jgi:rSAM/selenodomain-associated transferase 1
MTPPEQSCAIAIIAKAPRPGHVKTRLQAVLHPDEAAAMGTAFLRDTIANLLQAGHQAPIAPFIAYAPAGEESRFDNIIPEGVSLLLADGTNGDAPGVQGFGRVLLDTTRTLLARGYGAVCVLCADSPTLPTAYLVSAARHLLDGTTVDGPVIRPDVVLGPAEDGGYWLLGLTKPHPEPYANITWSSDRVADETRDRCAAAGLRLVELRTWYDVDDPLALARLIGEGFSTYRPGSRPFAAAYTRAAITRHALARRLMAPAK